MYQLYCAQKTYAMSAHVLLEELGVDYELREISLYSDTQPADFVAASPHGRVPALAHPHGTVLESGAIALFLCDQHLQAGLGFEPDHPDRARFLQWLFYLSSTVQPEVLIQFHPEHYFSEPDLQSNLKAASMKRLMVAWGVLDDACSAGPWFFGDRLTAVDICLGIQLQWPECFADGIGTFPNLARLLTALSARPAYQSAMRWHLS